MASLVFNSLPWVLGIAAILISSARGQQCGPTVTCSDGSPSQGKVTVTGQGSVKMAPDEATIDIAIQVTRSNATDAREAGAAAANATLAALSAAGVNDSDISTSGVSLLPQMEYEPMSGAARPKGITFTENFQVKLANISETAISNIVDKVIAAGGDALQVNGVNTKLSPEKMRDAMSQARQIAVQDALNTAQVLATAANLTLGPITLIQDNNYNPGPIYAKGGMEAADVAAAAPEATPTQIIVGDFETTVSVNLEIALCKSGTA